MSPLHARVANHSDLTALAARVAVGVGTLGITIASAPGPLAPVGAAAFLGSWLLVGLMCGPFIAADRILRTPWLLALPLLAVTSVLWSDAPGASLRAGLQFLLTAGFAVLAARSVPPRDFVPALLMALLIGALLCLPFGRTVLDPLTGETTFVGIFAAKNSMAFFMAMLILFGVALAMDRRRPTAMRLVGLVAIILAAPLLVKARSAGALIGALVAVSLMLGVLLLARLPLRERAILGASALVLLFPVVGMLGVLTATGTLGEATASFLTSVLGKDLTLTGRTVLWTHALPLIEEQPLLGRGYGGFWQQGNVWAEGLWQQFKIRSRSGFHFHNTYIEVAVNLGGAGAVAVILLLFGALARSFAQCVSQRDINDAVLFAVVSLLVIRSFIEVETIFPFTIGVFLIFAIATYGWDQARARREAARAVRAATRGVLPQAAPPATRSAADTPPPI